MKDSWLWWKKDDIETERRQLADEGRDTSEVNGEFDRLLAPDVPDDAAFQEAANALLDKASLLPTRRDYPYDEPCGLDEIRARRPAAPRPPDPDSSGVSRQSRIAGAWLGRCAGCLLGKPVEGIRSPAMRALLDCAGCEEIPDYLWRLPGVSDADHRRLGLASLPAWRDTAFMPEDDDTNYTIANMALVKAKGLGFSPADVADFWMANIPILRTCTAERAAYRNFVNNVEPRRSASFRNPYREWIGAQIRADFFGYAALGKPGLAAELAWRDASVSHVKNGMYGEMWVAAMLAGAGGAADAARVLEIGLGEIPANCRLAEGVRDVLSWRANGEPYDGAVRRIHRRWNENQAHDWCHVISNAQIVATALLYGEGDFGKAVTRAVYPCFDTDCNGATVGSIMGMMLGAEALPPKWTGVMRDTIHSGIAGYHVCGISRLGEEMFKLHATSEQSQRNGG